MREKIEKIAIVAVCLIGAISVAYAATQNDEIEDIAGQSIVAAQKVPMPTVLDPNFETQVNRCFLPIAELYGYALRITSGWRSVEEQDLLYAQGREINGHIVTYAIGGRSLHNFGFAIDVVDRYRGYETDWKRLGKIGAYCGLEQGDEEYDELTHFQHRQGITLDEFAAGRRPGQLKLPCEIMNVGAGSEDGLTFKGLQACGAPRF